MTEEKQKQLGKTLWAIADQLRGAMDADDFRDYMLGKSYTERNNKLCAIIQKIAEAKNRHNRFLIELGSKPLP